VLRHDAEGRHVGKLTHVGRRECQGNGHSIVGNRIGCVFCLRDLAVFIRLRDKIGAAVCVVIFKRKQNILCRDWFSIRPRHARLDGVDPRDGIFRFVGSKQRMVTALRVLPDERQLADAAGKHIEVILAERRCLNGSRRADRELLDGICESLRFRRLLRLCRFRRLILSLCWLFRWLLRLGFRGAAGCQSKYEAQAEQQSKKFFHLWFSFV